MSEYQRAEAAEAEVAELRAAKDSLRRDRDRHREQEKRLRGLIWEFGLRFASGSPERKWSSAALYDEVEPVGDDFRTDAPLPEGRFARLQAKLDAMRALRPADPYFECTDLQERAATPEEVDDGCELGVAYDLCGKCLSCRLFAALDEEET